MSNGPFIKVDADALHPLVDVAKKSKKPGIRTAALDAMSRFPLSPEAWRVYGDVVRRALKKEEPGTRQRRSAIEMGVRVPLMSVRKEVRSIATKDPVDGRVARYWLDYVGDSSGIDPLIARFRSGRAAPEAYQLLARMPLEQSGIKPADIPKLPAKPGFNAALWRSLALGRLGDYSALDALLARLGNEGPASPRRVRMRRAVASILPLPAKLQQRLLASMPELVVEMAGRNVQPPPPRACRTTLLATHRARSLDRFEGNRPMGVRRKRRSRSDVRHQDDSESLSFVDRWRSGS